MVEVAAAVLQIEILFTCIRGISGQAVGSLVVQMLWSVSISGKGTNIDNDATWIEKDFYKEIMIHSD